jgi:hypothetical protein
VADVVIDNLPDHGESRQMTESSLQPGDLLDFLYGGAEMEPGLNASAVGPARSGHYLQWGESEHGRGRDPELAEYGAQLTETRERRSGGDDPLFHQHGEPSLGSHLVTPRRGYTHHGIYVGAGRVVHYSGSAHGFRRGPVEEVPLPHFARGRAVRVRVHVAPRFDREQIVRRARARVGENCYRLLNNNCEHFCEWCVHGRSRSLQVAACLIVPQRVLQRVVAFMAQLLGSQGDSQPVNRRLTDISRSMS